MYLTAPPNHPRYNGKFLTKQPSAYQSTVLWAASYTTFFRFLRVSEFTMPSQQNYDPLYHQSLSDIALDHQHVPTTVRLHIKQSKRDPHRKGVYIYLAKTNQSVCRVNAIIDTLPSKEEKKGHFSLLLMAQCSQGICSLQRSCTNWT